MAKKKKPKGGYMTSTDLAVQSEKASKLARLDGSSQEYTPDAGDLLVPRISVMTGTSARVQDGVAKPGEFRDSVNGELFGTIDAPFEFIPFNMNKSLFVTQGSKFLRVETFRPDYERESMLDGKPVTRMVNYEFAVLIPAQCDVGISMPYLISFKSTAEKVGKKLLNQMFVANKIKGLKPEAIVCELGGKWVENDKGKYVLPDVRPIRLAKDEELKQAATWAKTLGGGNFKTDVPEE